MVVYFIAKACKGHEYAYKRDTAIKCTSEKQAKGLAEYLNKNNDKMQGLLKTDATQVWHNYTDADWYIVPPYKASKRNGKIIIKAQ